MAYAQCSGIPHPVKPPSNRFCDDFYKNGRGADSDILTSGGKESGRRRERRGNVTSFTYDTVSNLTTITDALNREYAYTFDEINQTKTWTFPR
jgi:YD repeat-containing protein